MGPNRGVQGNLPSRGGRGVEAAISKFLPHASCPFAPPFEQQ